MNPAIHRALASGIRLRPSGRDFLLAVTAVLVVTCSRSASWRSPRRIPDASPRTIAGSSTPSRSSRQLDEVLSPKKDAETGQRGYRA